jgi:K+-transporting ATPase ATPase C chain
MRTIIIALKVFIFFSLFTGIIYPLIITGIAQALFPEKANGSILKKMVK